MTYAMLSVATVLKAANAAMNEDLDPHDLDGLSALTRLNLIAALAMTAQQEEPSVTTMAISPEDFALLSAKWQEAQDARGGRGGATVTNIR